MSDFARIYSWNPFRMNAFAYDGEGDGSSSGTVSSGPTDSGGAPAPTPSEGGSGSSGSSSASGAGDVTTGSGSVDGGGDAFAGLDDDLDVIDLGLDGAPQGDGPGAAPSEGAPPAQAAPAAPQTGNQPPAAQQTPPAAPAAPSPPSAPRSAREELDDAINGFKNNFTELSEWATGEMFKLSDADREALDTDAVSVIPKLMARTYTQGLAAAANLIRNFVPRMIEQGFQQSQKQAEKAASAKNDFYKAWPDLKPEQHDAAMNKWARMYRQTNPQASRADAIAFVGRAVMAEFGLTPSGRPNGGVQQSSRPASFQPARPGGRPQASVPVDDPYAGMDQDFLDSE